MIFPMRPVLAGILVSVLLLAPSRAAEEKKAGSAMAFLAQVMIDYLDTNNDKAVDLGEFQSGCEKGFGEMDTDGDGFISDKELAALGGMLAESKEASGFTATAAGVLLASWIKTMDADKDGRVSRDEFVKGCEKYFGKLDANHDNKLTLEELLELPARILGK